MGSVCPVRCPNTEPCEIILQLTKACGAQVDIAAPPLTSIEVSRGVVTAGNLTLAFHLVPDEEASVDHSMQEGETVCRPSSCKDCTAPHRSPVLLIACSKRLSTQS